MPSATPLSRQSAIPPTPHLPFVQPLPLHPASQLSSLPLEASSRCLYERDLNSYLHSIWQHYFTDLPCANEVQIAYCRPWKTRLGLIRMSLDEAVSFIGINSLLRSPQVPECVLITTIAHELVHYTHGFGSPLPRLYDHPHANRVVEKELERRGLGSMLSDCDTWIEDHWCDFYTRRKIGHKKIGVGKRDFPEKALDKGTKV